MHILVPGRDELFLKTLILDLNGTVSVGGHIVEGLKERLAKVREFGLEIVLLTGNTRGDADRICKDLGIDFEVAKNSEDKKNYALAQDSKTCVSIGNGLIDKELMEVCGLSIAVLQSEGVHVQTLLACDLIVPNILDALDLLIDQSRLVASLRS